MFFLDHAKDIWYIVISLCAISLTVFLCFVLFYLAAAARDIRKSATTVKRRVEELDEAITGFRSKLLSYISLAAIPTLIVRKIMDFVKGEDVEEVFKTKKTKKENKKGNEGEEFYSEDI